MHDAIQKSSFKESGPPDSYRSAAPVILTVTRYGRVSDLVIRYTLDVADRLGYNILIAYVDTLPLLFDGGKRSSLMQDAVKENIALFRRMSECKNVRISSVKESGKVGKVIYRLSHIVRKIDFVVIDKDINMEEAAYWSPVPVFSPCCSDHSSSRLAPYRKKNSTRAHPSPHRSLWQKYVLKSAVLSGMLVGLYSLLFFNSERVMTYWTKGGVYTAFPILTVFVFFFLQSALIDTCISIMKKRRKAPHKDLQSSLRSNKLSHRLFRQ